MNAPSTTHVVLGAGPVGRATAALLAEHGHEVVLASRSGTGPALPGVTRVPVDAADAEQVNRLADGADVLYNCVNPATYLDWQAFWPPVTAALLTAAEKTGALLAITGTLYPYGPVEGPMTEGLPDAATTPKARLRAELWAAALAGHEAGRLRAVEVRGSDYVGPGVRPEAGHVARVAPAYLAGRTVRVMGRADVPHSFTDVRDVARTLATVAERPDTWGRIWHVPTNPARTQREVLGDLARSVGRDPGRVKEMPGLVLGLGGALVPMLRELRETAYQFSRPYVLDSAHSQRVLGLAPTPWDEVCRASAEAALDAG